MNAYALSQNIQFDDERDIATVYGVKIAGALLRALGEPTQPGRWLRVVKVEDGVSTIEQRTEETLRALNWISVGDRLPDPFTTVMVWVTGGSLHHDEDYADFGVYNSHDEAFQVNTSDIGDEAVPVSHWMPRPDAPA